MPCKREPVNDRCCSNPTCRFIGQFGANNITANRSYLVKGDRRARYLCGDCGSTASETYGTPYYKLRCTKGQFDRVASLRVEGMSKSAIARVERRGWNTVNRGLERASLAARKYNDKKLRGFELAELQADEIRTIAPSKEDAVWIFATIVVW